MRTASVTTIHPARREGEREEYLSEFIVLTPDDDERTIAMIRDNLDTHEVTVFLHDLTTSQVVDFCASRRDQLEDLEKWNATRIREEESHTAELRTG